MVSCQRIPLCVSTRRQAVSVQLELGDNGHDRCARLQFASMPDDLLRGGVLIIGPGIAGATCALELADAGEPVTTGSALDVTTVSSLGHLSRMLPLLASCKGYNMQAFCTVHGSG